jgi:anthranilate phosphoribosyltransferase
MTVKFAIEKCLQREDLNVDEAAAVLDRIMSGETPDSQIAGLLIALRAKGETIDEIVGFARTMRARSVRIRVEDPDAIDMCGTGGDGAGTFNISTVASFVVAGAGVTVAKHGNRSVSSRSGSADLLTSLGVNIQLPVEKVGACMEEVGMGFMFAPLFHPAMKHAARPRTDLGIRTIFNMLGPLTNPAGVGRQLVGTFRAESMTLLAGALGVLGTTKSCVVHGEGGMDEVTLSGRTAVAEVNGEEAHRDYGVTAADFMLSPSPAGSFGGGTPEENAGIAMRVLRGEPGSYRDIVVANAAVGLYVSGKAKDLAAGAARAAESIDSGRALETLENLKAYTNRP